MAAPPLGTEAAPARDSASSFVCWYIGLLRDSGTPCDWTGTWGRAVVLNNANQLHTYIRARIEQALGGRSWNWLSRTAGIPQSTLASQVAKPRFSVDVLLLVATALEKDLNHYHAAWN